MRLFVATAVMALVLAAAPAAAALTSSGTSSMLLAEAGGVRFRALNTSASQQEVYLGRSDLGVAGNRVAQNLTWQAGANRFSLAYDAATDTLTSIVNGGSALSFTNFVGGLTGDIAGRPLNFLQFQLRDGAVGAGTIGLTNLVLNGSALTPNLSAPEGQISYWGLFGNFGQSFTLTGNLDLAGSFGTSAEGNRVELIVGNAAAVPEPASWALMLGGFGLVGGALRRRRISHGVA